MRQKNCGRHQRHLETLTHLISFPTIEELDEEIDSWPDSINPFKLGESPKTSNKNEALQLAIDGKTVDRTDQPIIVLQM